MSRDVQILRRCVDFPSFQILLRLIISLLLLKFHTKLKPKPYFSLIKRFREIQRGLGKFRKAKRGLGRLREA